MSSPMAAHQSTLTERYRRVRSFSDALVTPLSAEDCMVQSMPDVSPMRWHLAHTTWFFETFVLSGRPGHTPFDEQFQYLFNSYYNTVGKQFPRPQRGLISRPGLARILEYRAHVDAQMDALLSSGGPSEDTNYAIEVGLNHEQQHQELMLTDIKHVLSCNPTLPAYAEAHFADCGAAEPTWTQHNCGTGEFGHDGSNFCFDNELPRHTAYLQDFEIADRLVTCGEFIEFIEANGYKTPQLWLSMGWSAVCDRDWDAPLYWVKREGQWLVYTLAGLVPINPAWPVCHVSYFEADAYARFSGARLPTEFEWECSAANQPIAGQFADGLLDADRAIHPTAASPNIYGGVWQWTSSSYSAYPGYRPPDGALGEYNGKFMCNQYVLRGGSVATSSDHIRPTYRNFFPPESRWQFAGIRLAR